MRLVSKVCQKHKLTKRVEKMSGLQSPTLNLLLSRKLRRIHRVDFYGIHEALFLIVQYLFEESREMKLTSPDRAKRLEAAAREIISLYQEAFYMPDDKAYYDGPTERIRPKSGR